MRSSPASGTKTLTPEDTGAPPSREELLAARARIERQIEILENPVRARDRYPSGVAKLRAMLAEIDECLAAFDAD